MQLNPSQLSAHLQKGLRSLYVLQGDEPLLQQEAADAIRPAARAQDYLELSSFTVSCANCDLRVVVAAGVSKYLLDENI